MTLTLTIGGVTIQVEVPAGMTLTSAAFQSRVLMPALLALQMRLSEGDPSDR